MENQSATRRSLLAGATATMAAAPYLIGLAGSASAAATDMPWRAVHRFALGDMTITVIDDARAAFPAAMFAVNQPEGTPQAFLQSYGMSQEFVFPHMLVTLVETANSKVLLDTGMGDLVFPGNEPDNGRLGAGLALIGLGPDDITDVILSHGHPDHIGGCSINGAPCFKNATYHIAPEELEFWTQKPGEEENFMNLMLGIGNAKLNPVRDLVSPYKDGEEILPGITAVAAPGHTLGHHAFHLKSGNAQLLHIMDSAVHYLIGTEQPDWALGVEIDQSAAAASRRKLFGMAAESKIPLAGYHFPFPGIGHIIEMGDAWRFVPVQTA